MHIKVVLIFEFSNYWLSISILILQDYKKEMFIKYVNDTKPHFGLYELKWLKNYQSE